MNKNDITLKERSESSLMHQISYKNYEVLVIKINNEFFGIPTLEIKDVLMISDITIVPLMPSQILGFINLRGKIVTVLNTKILLKFNDDKDLGYDIFGIVLGNGVELYTLIVDSIIGFTQIVPNSIITNTKNYSQNLAEVSKGIYILEKELITILDIGKLLQKLEAS